MLSQLSPSFSVSRGSNSYQFDRAGSLVVAAADTPAICFDPATQAPQGLWINQAQTNYVANPRCEGGVAGSPGTVPTSWSFLATVGGVTREMSAPTVEDGIPCIDLRYYGTPALTSFMSHYFQFATATPATPGQSWTGAMNVRLVGGTLANTRFEQRVITRNSAQGGVDFSTPIFVPSTNRLSTCRLSTTIASASATTAYANIGFGIQVTVGMPIDFTIRVGAPTLAQSSITQPIILPLAGAQGNSTRAVDTLRLTDGAFAQRVNPTQGTIVVDAVMLRSVAQNALARVLQLNDGSINNTIDLFVTGTTVAAQVAIATVQQGSTPGYPASAGERVRYVLRWQPGSVRHAAMGNLYGTITTALPTISQVWIGNRPDTGRALNGYVEKVAIYPYAVSDTRQQAISVLGAPL
jgi:hypothetical protein